ncbi:lipoate--protein ligase family protein [Paracoccus marinaquae]|uniref:BPL/LPL catalytic domain-containing protein n=1 Tax=Paracoccus marinaquae TaxID=2841926 RepID=A0ABS6AFS3_9RHOB|nr:hypothetical protein [Paracoccus marinaquae]MBU3029444.1 hypothetical protein [Paracoccus marinaquae]
MTPLRVIDSGLADACANVAMSGALAELHQAGRIGDTLRLHRYPRSVLLGLHSPEEAVDRAACARLGAQVVRRVSGGGAIAMEPGILAWDLLVTRPPNRAPEDLSRDLCEAIAAALAGCGVEAAFRAPGDIVAREGKLGGTAGLFEGMTMLHQGSLLIDADPGVMAQLLGMADLPVTTLARIAAEPPEAGRVAGVIARAIAAALGRDPVQGDLSTEEIAMARRMAGKEMPWPAAC